MPNLISVSGYMGSGLVWLCYMVVVSLNSFCRRANSCTEDSFRWCGILFWSASARFAAAAMTASSGSTVGFVMYLCLKNTVPDTLVARVSFTHNFQHR